MRKNTFEKLLSYKTFVTIRGKMIIKKSIQVLEPNQIFNIIIFDWALIY
jgi:CTP:phosphocholine cytidylyltransferase-like protein